MKPMLEVALEEWAGTRDKLLDTYVEKTAETAYLSDFKDKVKNERNLDLDRFKPAHPDSLDGVIREINAIRSVIEDIDDFIDDEYDPYCEDVYHENDPRLYRDV